MSNLAHKIPEAMKLRRRGTRYFDTNLFPPEEDGAIESRSLTLEFEFEMTNFSRIVFLIKQKSLGKERRSQEMISILCWSSWRCNSQPSSNPKSFRKKSDWSIFTWERDDPHDFFQVHLSRWHSPDLHSIVSSGLQQEEEFPKGNVRRYSLSRGLLWQCIFTSKESSKSPSPEFLFYKQKWKVHQNAVYLRLT